MRWNRLKGVTWSRPQSNSQRHQAIDMHPRDERRVDKANNGSLRQCCCAGACTENTTSTKPLLTTCSIRSSHYSVHPGAGPPLGLHTVRASTPADNGKGAGNDLRHLLPASTSPPIKFSLFNNGLFSSKLCCALRCWCKTCSIMQGSSLKCCI